VQAAARRTCEVIDWTVDHAASYFRAVRIEKTMMALILLLIVAVAAFNIVAMLVMTVTDKRTDIAILRTLRRLAAHA
jgi:lipoprotein-releasing system permease protein